MESFFARLKVECTYAEKLRAKDDAYACVFEYIELFYSTCRRSSNGYKSLDHYQNECYAKCA